ncbi:acyl-ACP--UDP-N-acetylglucosamine O-acyltransferase [Hyphomonas johnsonii]|uniref:Acyl-(Acyl-carrier-protein)--UDP-N-acetylglucosamine O-acyltransferase n=1 Tax=Hyphomonas johnsonii MHS-2 TaxID=1280950 RepID=A0A059FV33_9PROT|nr:acyl-ACP--UDP-N-acetylglucosamine O-acyltransferase [Hyphomonas johnsonii]KCZ94381.1 acyl-(acyl-carrier-protein)--UDP-N-acetylglucosamine O-acyltransferase [Hyphomonas johnsonii MHS-2]
MPVEIHQTALVEPGAELGEGVRIGPFCQVGPRAVIGAGTELRSHSVVTGFTRLGEACVLHPHAVVGGPPQVIGFQETDESRLEIGDNCTFREYTTAHTGIPKFGGVTKIGNDCFIMVGGHIAHDCHIGNSVVMANNVLIGGHVTVGDNVWFGGLVAVHQFTRIGRNAFIGGGAILVEDVIPFGSVIGNRARLAGLNVVGLKRRGFDKAQLHEIRSAYKAVFSGDGLFKDRLDLAARTFAGKPLAMELIDFILAGGNRAICKPG